jgi:hypothetical protein
VIKEVSIPGISAEESRKMQTNALPALNSGSQTFFLFLTKLPHGQA